MTLLSSLRDTPKYPVSQRLRALLYDHIAPNGRSRRTDKNSSDVVSPELCDDVLNLLAPSLQAYHGCDIIDLHPGPCLWSQKLHALIKPRRHLLMESNPVFFEPFIKPLLDSPGSAYRHTTISGAHPKSYWSAYDLIFNDELLPKRIQADHDLRREDKSLLVTGCLHREYSDLRLFQNAVSSSSMILNHMVQAAQTNSMFHAAGLVRMLFWVPTTTRDQVYPSSLHAKSPFNFAIDMSADITEVAGVPRENDAIASHSRSLRKRVRPLRLEQESIELTLARQKQQGLLARVPESRRSAPLRLAIESKSEPAFFASKIKTAVAGSTLVQQVGSFKSDLGVFLAELSTRTQKFSFMRANKFPENKNFSGKFEYTLPPEVVETKFIAPRRTRENVEPFAELSHRQIALEERLCASKLPDKVRLETENRLLETAQLLRDSHPQLGASECMKFVLSTLEEERAMQYSTALLPRDRRSYEPLVARPDEFWPQEPLHLLDIRPLAATLASDITSAAEGNAVMRSLAQTLLMRERENVGRSLDRVAPNAGRDIVAATPLLRNAAAGGRLDVRDLSVRMLTRELFAALVTAFLEWPFRPSAAELTVTRSLDAPGNDVKKV